MIVLEGFSESDSASCLGGMLAIGNFDGVHLGHQRMLNVLTRQAKSLGVPAIVLTFDPPPVQLLRPDAAPPRLTTIQTKAELIEQQGVDCLIVYPTDLALLNLTPQAFFDEIVIKKLSAIGLVEGPNFYFGKNRQGDVKLLKTLCRAAGCEVHIIEPEVVGEDWISSSRIRELISAGELGRAVDMLGHPYHLEGRVIRGEERGRTLGFPTANLAEIPTLIPADGVYAGRGWIRETPYPAAVHVGPNPTFGEDHRKVEVHLLDASCDLYGGPLKVDLLTRIRGTRAFSTVEELQVQIGRDLAEVRRITGGL